MKKNRTQNELIPNSLSFANIHNVHVIEYVDIHKEMSEGNITKMLTVVTLVWLQDWNCGYFLLVLYSFPVFFKLSTMSMCCFFIKKKSNTCLSF